MKRAHLPGRPWESERELRIAAEQETDVSGVRASLAETLVALKRDAEAKALLSGLLAKEPNHAGVQTAMGRLRRAQGRLDEAAALLATAAERTGNVDLFVVLGETYLEAGKAREALEAARHALARNSGHPLALAVEGHALLLLGGRDEGLGVLKRAIALKPRRPDAWLALARAFDAAGDSASAARCRGQAKELGEA